MSDATTRLVEQLVAAAHNGDTATVGRQVLDALGLPRHTANTVNPPTVRIYRWICWLCNGGGRDETGDRCMECHGYGLLTADDIGDPAAYGDDLKPAPRPPAVMKAPCVDCALRPGSPEDGYTSPGVDKPFYCHHGLWRVGDGYESTAYVGNLPLGAMVCAGWWALATGEALPAKPFRDPGGADRPEAAPEVA